MSAFAVASLDGQVLLGNAWLSAVPPTTREPELFVKRVYKQAGLDTYAAHQLRTSLAGLQAQVEAWAQAVNTTAAGSIQAVFTEKVPVAPEERAQAAIILGADQVNHMRNAVRRTSQLANQLLALSRADARSLDAQPLQPVDLKALCESLLEQHLDAAFAKHIDLGLEVQAVQVTGHEWLLR